MKLYQINEGWNVKIRENIEYATEIDILKDYLSKITKTIFQNENHATFEIVITCEKDEYDYSVTFKENTICLNSSNGDIETLVYIFLEEYFNIKYLTPTVDFIPYYPVLEIVQKEYKFTPTLKYRKVYYKCFEDEVFAKKSRVACNLIDREWIFWSHSFKELLPYELFCTNPEYFALIEGERVKNAQPCLSNKSVREIMIKNIDRHILENPTKKYISISQNDDNLYCRCEKCAAIDLENESQMGSVLTFVNEVALLYPNMTISTLAYWYTRKVPKIIRPESNVHIMLCNIEAKLHEPIETCKMNIESKEELQSWSLITKNMLIWDYNIQFRNLLSPFPNLDVLFPNMRFYLKNNTKSIFRQANREAGGDMHELKAYLLAKSTWDATLDENTIIKDFCYSYYGPAGKYILEYIYLLHKNKKKNKVVLDMFGNPGEYKDTFLSKNSIKKYLEIFDSALYVAKERNTTLFSSLEDQPFDYTKRVEDFILSLYYVIIYNRYGDRNTQLDAIEKFVKICKRNNITMIEEWNITTDLFVIDALHNL